jgi:antitoxin component YwqK of YwqJK toxin-antitoxin module
MNIPRIMMIAALFALLCTGCKVRRISDGKPPRDGVVVSQRNDPRFGMIRTEQHYREGKQVYLKGEYGDGRLAFERFNGIAGGTLDSAAWFFPSGALFHTLVTTDERIIRYKEYFEDGALRIDSDTTVNNEFYQSGKKYVVIRYENGSVVSIERWFENGKHAEVSEWRNERRHGRYETWDSTGRSLINERYVNGTMKARKNTEQL